MPDEFERTAVQPIPVPPPLPPLPPPVPPVPIGPPAPRRRSLLLPLLIGCGGPLLTLLVIGAVLSQQRSNRSADPNTATTQLAPEQTTTTVPEGATRASAVPVGTALSPAKDWTVTVVGVEFDADASMAAQSFLSRPREGRQFVLVSVSATNGKAEPATPGIDMKASLVTPSGTIHSVTFKPAPDAIEGFSAVPPGDTVTGNLAFEIPEADVTEVVLLVEPQFSLTPAKDKRFFALR